MRLRAYMGYNRNSTSWEGAVLIFASSVKEAKKLAWRSVIAGDCYIDLAVEWLKNKPWLFKEMIKETAHVIENPKTCEVCNYWGAEELDESGICSGCKEIMEEER